MRQPTVAVPVCQRLACRKFSKPGQQNLKSERSYWEPRRRGFDDQGFAPSRPERSDAQGFRRQQPAGPAIDATVKWFSPEKGFGFVTLGDGSGDAFLHAGVVERSGRDAAVLQPGTRLQVRIEQGQKGSQVGEILEVDTSTVVPDAKPKRERAPLGREASGRDAFDRQPSRMTGRVKWYNAAKGFGFVVSEDQGQDVFVRAAVLQQSGLSLLTEGQRVDMQVIAGWKGLEALSVTVR